MSQSKMYRIQHSNGAEDFNTELAATNEAKQIVASGLSVRVEIYKLCKVVTGELKVTVTDPGVVPQGDTCGNS